MPPNPLALAYDSAMRYNNQLGVLFGRMGTLEHPNGRLLVAYRNIRRALKGALVDGGLYPVAAAGEVLDGLHQTVEDESRRLIDLAVLLGERHFHDQLLAYQARSINPLNATTRTIRTAAALDAVLAEVERQSRTAKAMLISGTDLALILGDAERLGVIQPSSVLRALAQWLAQVAQGEFSDLADGQFMVGSKTVTYRKQCVAALDARTTDCCLRATGQIVDMNADFQLDGYPRFADELPNPPFHWWCRTATVLYLPEFDLGLTDRMRDGARQIMDERAAGGTGERHPADAFAR